MRVVARSDRQVAGRNPAIDKGGGRPELRRDGCQVTVIEIDRNGKQVAETPLQSFVTRIRRR